MREMGVCRAPAILFALVLMITCIALFSMAERTKTPTSSGDPGNAPYTPTKLQWAALELQADFGRNWSSDDHVAVSFMPGQDGRTIRCRLQYTPDVSAQDLETSRAVAQTILGKYAAHQGWPWLQITFQESSLPAPHPLVPGNQ